MRVHVVKLYLAGFIAPDDATCAQLARTDKNIFFHKAYGPHGVVTLGCLDFQSHACSFEFNKICCVCAQFPLVCAWLLPRLLQDHLRAGTDLSLVLEGARVSFRLATSEKHQQRARGSDVAFLDQGLERTANEIDVEGDEADACEAKSEPQETIEESEDQNVSRASGFLRVIHVDDRICGIQVDARICACKYSDQILWHSCRAGLEPQLPSLR